MIQLCASRPRSCQQLFVPTHIRHATNPPEPPLIAAAMFEQANTLATHHVGVVNEQGAILPQPVQQARE